MMGRGKTGIYMLSVLLLLIFCGSSFAQNSQAQKNNWLSGMIIKLERMKADSTAYIQKCEREIQKSESTVRKSEDIIKQAQQRGNRNAEMIARDAMRIAQESIKKNRKMMDLSERNKKSAEEALAYAKRGDKNLESKLEQFELENNRADWTKTQGQLIEQRLTESNKWCSGIYASLKTKAPPLPYKSFDELQPGDTLLIEGNILITKPDQILSGDTVSHVSHTVLYLKELNGTKLFLDDQPKEGARIIPEDYFLKKYGSRGLEVAKLAQPLNKEEADRLYSAAKEMRAGNLDKIEANNWFDKTNWGMWNKENAVCSEADWALIKAAGRQIPKSDDRIKKLLGIDFSPADFYSNEQYFLVSPLAIPKK